MASQPGNACVSHAKRVVEQHIPMHYDSHWLVEFSPKLYMIPPNGRCLFPILRNLCRLNYGRLQRINDFYKV